MNIKVSSVGGAAAGMFGSTGAESDILNNLKKSAVAFSEAYAKENPDASALLASSQEVEGHLQILQATNTISQDTASKLMSELQALVAARRAAAQ